MVHHDLKTFTVGKLHQFLRLPHGRGEGFLHEHVLAVLKGLLGKLKVSKNRGDYRHRVDRGRFQDGVGIGGDLDGGICLSGLFEHVRTAIRWRTVFSIKLAPFSVSGVLMNRKIY